MTTVVSHKSCRRFCRSIEIKSRKTSSICPSILWLSGYGEKKSSCSPVTVTVLRMHLPFISHQKSKAILQDFYLRRQNHTGNYPILNATSYGRWEIKVYLLSLDEAPVSLSLFWPNLLFPGLLRNFTWQNPFSQGDISWHSFLSLRSFTFLCFQVKKMELHVKNVGSGPSLAFWRNFMQLKQTKGTLEERASCSWPYFYLPPSFLRLNMPTKRNKQNTLRCFFFFFLQELRQCTTLMNMVSSSCCY